MSGLHDLCRLSERPVLLEHVKALRQYLKAGIPATYTVEEAYSYENGIEEEASTTTTPLHIMARHIPTDLGEEELDEVCNMIETLLEYGAGWSLTDIDDKTPGCILVDRGMKGSKAYQLIVEAGVRAELLLRTVEDNVEFIDFDEDEKSLASEEGTRSETTDRSNKVQGELETSHSEIATTEVGEDPAIDQAAYLKSKLEYKEDALITASGKDGVMMSWETDIMRLGTESLFKGVDGESVVLNIGFGMGIIDTMINNKEPTKQYICEAHPDVLRKMKQDGWYEKSNVVILEGRWQDTLCELLGNCTVFFDGIYYDTFSEHYLDMLELLDCVVGLLKPGGVFSFFNGLGADRQVVYDVYKNLLDLDLSNYGLSCTYTEVPIPESTLHKGSGESKGSVWDGVKRSYWNCPVYYHPEIKFIEI